MLKRNRTVFVLPSNGRLCAREFCRHPRIAHAGRAQHLGIRRIAAHDREPAATELAEGVGVGVDYGKRYARRGAALDDPAPQLA